MVKRELLARHRRGRKVYLALTPRAVAVLEDGHRRIWETGAVNRDWNGSWTLVGFSLPDSRRNERHDLRSQLVWAGFGPLQHGLWIAAGTVDVVRIVEDLGLADAVTVLTAQAMKPTESADLVGKAFDVAAIAGRSSSYARTRTCRPSISRTAGPPSAPRRCSARWPQGTSRRRPGSRRRCSTRSPSRRATRSPRRTRSRPRAPERPRC
jgi:phenylacetic acid degradation operon negative regulatory protein